MAEAQFDEMTNSSCLGGLEKLAELGLPVERMRHGDKDGLDTFQGRSIRARIFPLEGYDVGSCIGELAHRHHIFRADANLGCLGVPWEVDEE